MKDSTPEQTRAPAPFDEGDELEQARRRKRYEEIKARLDESFAAMRSAARSLARLVLWTEAFSETDLHLMLRGQILTFKDGEHWPCRQSGDDEDFESPCDIEDKKEDEELFYKVRWRDCDQAGLRGPLDPVPAPRTHLVCPLIERARNGDATVPCYYAQRKLPKGARLLPPRRSERRARQALEQLIELRQTPCGIFHQLARDSIEHLVHASPPPPPPPKAEEDGGGDLMQRHVRKHLRVFQDHRQRRDHEQAEEARAGLLFLHETHRLERWDMAFLLDHGAYITDLGWLPCRDDPQRNLYFNRLHTTLPSDHFIHERWMASTETRHLCPLQVRARLGDRTSPCCEALKDPPDPAWIETELRGQEIEVQQGKRTSVSKPAELLDSHEPRYWQGPEDQPGGPADPVVVHRMHPCHMLGRLLARDLYSLAQALADSPEEEDDPPRNPI